MNGRRNVWQRLMVEDDGATMLEYALLAGMIGVAAVAVLTLVRNNVVGTLTLVNDAFVAASVGDAG